MKDHDKTGIYIIVAMTEDGIIGKGNELPWRISEELKLFKKLTLESTVIMGRHTFESIGRSLPDRNNIVVSSTLPPREGLQIAKNLDEALMLGYSLEKKIFVIGGAELYEKALSVADYMYVSRIHDRYEGDVRFPLYDKSLWHLDYEVSFDEFTLCFYSMTPKQ
ncbi:MAG: hypothetical protein CXR30_01615 [Geobacter sp.]|nr:MAG: hypothetical protein CXR30_01615 [Geobacter sp.]